MLFRPVSRLPQSGSLLTTHPAQRSAWPAPLRQALDERLAQHGYAVLPTLGLLGAIDQVAALQLNDTSPLLVRRRHGRVARELGAISALTYLPDPAWTRAQQEQALIGLAQGFYQFEAYRSKPRPRPQHLEVLLGKGGAALCARSQAAAQAIALCRDLINTPAEDLGPEAFIHQARTACKGTPLRLQVWDHKRIERAGMGCLAAVGRASHRPPRLLMIDLPGRGRPLALCGKGVCFDTGGLNLKPERSMALMRKDMGGAATVLAALLWHVRQGGKGPIRAYLPLVENAIGPQAFRPGDILRAMDGTTVEIGNTDAEGRLILADAIALARRDQARGIISVATLTGAALVALGRIHVPIMGTDDALLSLLEAGAQSSGEKVWRLPLDEEHQAIMQGTWADLTNDGNGEAGCITAGAFLAHFAGNTPFAHADISPASWMMKPHDLGPAGASGTFVSTLAHALCRSASTTQSTRDAQIPPARKTYRATARRSGL